MSSKPPSSLDYEAFLHELALKNWRRALLDGDARRAESNASRLTTSQDKVWRFVGGVHLARARLCRGVASAAVDALADALHETRELAIIAKALMAHIHLETHSPRRALEVLETLELDDPRHEKSEARHWHALARVRMGEREHTGALLGHLEQAARGFEGTPPASPEPAAPIRFALGAALLETKQTDRARAIFEDITASRETLVHWPIPYVRSVFRVGQLAAHDGNEERAREAFSEFLLWWKDGELDRWEVSEADQFVNA